MKVVTASLVGLLIGIPLAAQEAAQEPVYLRTPQEGEQPREHVVKKGDTLWDLAQLYYSNPWVWPTIWDANPMVVEDPHWIYPQEVLVIPGLYQSGDAAPGALAGPAPGTEPVRATQPTGPTAPRSARTVFYRPPLVAPRQEAPTVLSEAGRENLPVKPDEFHAAEFLADPDDLELYGRMIRPVRAVELAQRESRQSAHPRDMVFLGYAGRARPEVGSRLLMVRPGRSVWGQGNVIHPTGVVRVVALHDEVMEAQLEKQFGPVLLDQLAVPLGLFPDFLATEAEPVEGEDLEAVVITFATEQPLYGIMERGFINAGAEHGVKPGDVFVAYLPERASRRQDVEEFARNIEELPPEAVAELRIVRVGENHATFRVDRVLLPLLEDGVRVRRIRRMP